MEIPIACAGKVGENLVAPTRRQFGYLFRYATYIEDLEQQVKKLVSKRNGLKIFVEERRKNGETIRAEVEDWFVRVDGVEKEALKFIEEAKVIKKHLRCGRLPNLSTRYRAGKEAKQKIKMVNDLLQEGAFGVISTSAPPPGIESFISSKGNEIYDTTNKVMTEAMQALKDDNINFLGIYGMGGVGKTTLVKELIHKIVKEERLFDQILMVSVGQNKNENIRLIQGQMRDQLGLTFEEESELGRAHRLKTRLKDLKMVLIILDDVWDEKLDFAAIGIPFGDDHTGSKVVVTTRTASVCRALGRERWTPKMIHVQCLSDQESWALFKKNAPDITSSAKLREVAYEISRKCGGLPLALVTTARALTGKDLNEWEMAAQELKNSTAISIPGVDEDVGKVLKLSYDKLKQEDAKDLFLLCSMFPEDSDILIEDLVLYGFGLGMFGVVDTVQAARRRVNSRINILQDSSLLLSSDKEGCVKMHDVIRDMALSIGSNKYLVKAGVPLMDWQDTVQVNNYIGVSFMNSGFEGSRPLIKCSNLQVLLVQHNPLYWKYNFKGMETLRVLDIRHTTFDESLTGGIPPDVSGLKSLRTLVLDGNCIKDTSFIGKIKTLEILSLKSCEFHKKLNGVNLLTKLRFLDMSSCELTNVDDLMFKARWQRRQFSCDVDLSSLSRLEELYLFNTKITRRLISSLKSLPRLRALTISIVDTELVPHDFVFPDLETFVVCFSKSEQYPAPVPNYLWVENVNFIRLRKFISRLCKRTNTLHLHLSEGTENIIPGLVSCNDDGDDGETSLKTIEISDCVDFSYLIDKVAKQQDLLAFSNLETLDLRYLKSFRGICRGRSVQLYSLRIVRISECISLETIFNSSVARSLENMEELTVKNCPALEEIIQTDQKGEEPDVLPNDIISFNNLKKLEIGYHINLKAFCLSRNIQFKFPLLEEVRLYDCPKMKDFRVESTPKLKVIELDEKKITVQRGMDFNMVIQNYFEEKEKSAKCSTEEGGTRVP